MAAKPLVIFPRTVGLKKRNILTYLAGRAEADAQDLMREFGVRYSVAAMALLRLFRQGLAIRHRDGGGGGYRYRLSERGQSRLAYLENSRGAQDEG